MLYFGNLCAIISLASLKLYLYVVIMLRKILKTTTFLFLSMCLTLGNNVVHAGGGQSSASTAAQGGGGPFSGGGFGGASGAGSSGVR